MTVLVLFIVGFFACGFGISILGNVPPEDSFLSFVMCVLGLVLCVVGGFCWLGLFGLACGGSSEFERKEEHIEDLVRKYER